METRANYILIGAFTFLGILGALVFFAWLAKVEIDRQFSNYDILFDDVSGLSSASEVRFNGVVVGEVTSIGLDDDDPRKVRVRIEVAAETPVRTDTIAQLQSQGVTGVSFVALAGGEPTAPDPIPELRTGIPLIRSERSVLQALTQDAPDLLTQTMALLEDLQAFAGPENQTRVSNILSNLDQASGQLDKALTDFSNVSNTVSEGTAEIRRFTGKLDAIGSSIQTTLTNVDDTLATARSAIAQGEVTFGAATETLTAAQNTIASADVFLTERLPGIADELTATLTRAQTTITDLGAAASQTLSGYEETARLASARLAELETTLKSLDATMASANTSFAAVESASVSFETLVDGDGTALVADARQSLANLQGSITALDTVMTQDVPAIMVDIRGAIATANTAIDQASSDITAFTQTFEPLSKSAEVALQTATKTLETATTSLAKLDTTLDGADKMVAAAEKAFSGASDVIDTQVGPAMEDFRAAASNVETAMSQVTADLPQISEDLRATIARARDVVDRVDRMVATTAGPLRSFAETGLPEFTKFARAAQALTARLDTIAKKLERDPTRFFFGNNPPEFKR